MTTRDDVAILKIIVKHSAPGSDAYRMAMAELMGLAATTPFVIPTTF